MMRRRARSQAVRTQAPDLEGLRERLRRAKISHQMIADRARVARATVSLVLRGRTTSQRIVEVATALLRNPDGAGRPLGRWGKKHLDWLADVIKQERARSL
jgi:hypothetical protein